jgi:hypothetical protein
VRIKIKSAEVTVRDIKRARDQKQFKFREQEGFVTLGDETRRISLTLADDQAAYPMGEYEVLLDGSVYVDRNGRLALGRLALKPVLSATGNARVAG